MNKVSICITVKNRSKVLGRTILLNTVRSIINNITDKDNIELIITDWNSTDWPLKEWIYDEVKHVQFKLITIDKQGFNRGIGLNTAAEHATGNVLFFSESDVMIDRPTIDLALKIEDKALFPRIRRTTPTSHLIVRESRRWLRGFGIAIVRREWWETAGHYKSFWFDSTNWGGEDNQFHADIVSLGIPIERPKMNNLIHQWHPRKMFNEQV
jgi:glycosyltransferase involved in cell wall biosynthesis